MNTQGRVWQKLLKRHAEAIFIVSFILADCFLSGWALTAGTAMAMLYVFLPAIRAIPGLSPIGRITYLKAFVKTPQVHRLALLLFWIYSIRFVLYATTSANLFAPANFKSAGALGLLFNSFVVGAHEWAPLTFCASPILIYLGACAITSALRARLRPTKQDPDLISQRQQWCGGAHAIFTCAFIAAILSITLNASGPGYMLSNWFLASARDANFYLGENVGFDGSPQPPTEPFVATPQLCPPHFGSDFKPTPSFTPESLPLVSRTESYMYSVLPDCPVASFIGIFDKFVLTGLSALLFFLLLEPAVRLNSMLVSFCWRVTSFTSLQNVIEAFLQALRLPARTLSLSDANPGLSNAGRTLTWLLICYAGLFWLCGFCGGPVGTAIQNWLMTAVVDAGFANPSEVPAWVFGSNLRIFLGSIVALYGTAPLAVTAAVMLPYKKPRMIILNCDGVLFPQGPFLPLLGRPFRLWSDLKAITVTSNKNTKLVTAKFFLTFNSRGKVSFTNKQVRPQDLKVLLDSIDQYAVACAVDPEVLAALQTLEEEFVDAATTDGINDTAIASIPAAEFKSTTFVPYVGGECIPTRQIRIIKQLSSKPLCAVYLGRNESGRMVTIKQFYLHEENDETKALSKLLRREYELLSRLDHAAIAKVLESFSVENSTYLIIEHRIGADLRETVAEHGPRSEAVTISWARQLCEVMIHLHGCAPPILHRDLTPDNIIIGEDGILRLIDFGAAREFLDGITGTMIGKHCYIAPEQLRGTANQRSDIYSFGGTLYFLLTGRDPVSLAQSRPSSTIDCSGELDQLIRDCTEFDEEKRPQSFDEILNRLTKPNKGIRLKLPTVKEKVRA